MPIVHVRTVESIEHVWCCPAFDTERAALRNKLSRLLIELRLPFADKNIQSQEVKFCQQAVRKAKRLNSEKNYSFLTESLLYRLARDFWKASEHKNTISKSAFQARVQAVLPHCDCQMNDHKCGFKIPLTIQMELQSILQRNFLLLVEANTSSLGRSDLFGEYCSEDPNDRSFGSLGSFWETNLAGKNVFLVWNGNDRKHQDIQHILSLVQSKRPTRILIVAPSSMLPNNLPRSVLEIASISSGFQMLRSVDSIETTRTSSPLSIFLVINQESMLRPN